MKNYRFTLCVILGTGLFSQTLQAVESPKIAFDALERVTQVLVVPPLLPEHTQMKWLH